MENIGEEGEGIGEEGVGEGGVGDHMCDCGVGQFNLLLTDFSFILFQYFIRYLSHTIIPIIYLIKTLAVIFLI